MIIGVYGQGRFGAWWAGCLAKHFQVKAWSRNPDRVTFPNVQKVSEEELLSSDVVILCVAISAMETVLKRISPMLKSGTLVMDTCSVKIYPASKMKEILPENVEILATHPMFGPDSGKTSISGLPLVFSPLRISPIARQSWLENFLAMGLNVVEMTPDEHDRQAAYSQGVTHIVGRVLGEMNLASCETGTKGFNNLLDIIKQTCNDSWQLFLDLQKYNPYTTQMRTELQTAIDKMMQNFHSIEVI